MSTEGEGRQRAYCELPGWGDSASPPPGSRLTTLRRPPPSRGRWESAARLFLQEAGEFLLEARQPAAAVDQMLLAAGPGRMRFRIDVEPHGVAGLAPRAPCLELGAVGHHHLDGVIFRMNVALHGRTASILRRDGARRLRR